MVLCAFQKTKVIYYKSKHIKLLFNDSNTIRSHFSSIKISSLKRYSIIKIFNIKLPE